MSLEQYKDKIVKVVDSGSIAFEILEDNLFYATGYKVIQNFADGGLVRAMMTTLNGRMRLVYDVSGLSPLSAMLPKMSPEAFQNFALGLIELVDLIKSNGFIHGENVILDPDMVFLDISTFRARLIYLPLKQNISVTVQLDSLERNMAELLRSLLKSNPSLQSDATGELYNYLIQGFTGLEDLKNVILGSKHAEKPVLIQESNVNTETAVPEKIPESLFLERIGGNQGLRLRIAAPAAVIGRDTAVAQVLIPDSSVSKKHCLICKESNGWKIEDLQSSNHTWLGENETYLEPYKQYPIKPGDHLRIARFMFVVRAGNEE